MSETRDLPLVCKGKRSSSPVVFVITGIPRTLPSSKSGIPGTKIARLSLFFFLKSGTSLPSQCSVTCFGAVNVALIACADDFLTSLLAVHVLLIERVAFFGGTPHSVRIAPMSDVL
ncbi:hypothetical protein AVEN_75037-1 [Araneus ventricosus]|uniref:Uncharacterized protein n=1 Tax=Araneus ventricosus TaxID=182803 RepID=A0A4Y2GPE4_ARAVE|nr:hypothetical protein AVEN_75037-1 [Araneus ventricosus]